MGDALGVLGYWPGERWADVGHWIGPLGALVLAALLATHLATA